MGIVELEKEDVMRSEIVKEVLSLYVKPEMPKIDTSYRMEMKIDESFQDASLISKKEIQRLAKRKPL
jgi:hypothetical protein